MTNLVLTRGFWTSMKILKAGTLAARSVAAELRRLDRQWPANELPGFDRVAMLPPVGWYYTRAVTGAALVIKYRLTRIGVEIRFVGPS